MHPDTYKRPLLITLLILILGLCFFYKPTPGKQDVFHAISTGEVALVGRVESFAVTKKDSQNVIIRVFTVNGAPFSGHVYTRFKGQAPAFKEVVSFSGVLRAPYSVDLPGHFNWQRYLALKSIFAEIKSETFVPVRSANFLWRSVRALRTSILHVFEKSFSSDLAGIAGGILLGESGEIDSNLHTAFQDSGAIHLLVASGGNVGFVTLITLLVGSLIGLRRRPLLILTLITAGFYTLLAGADAPLVRAYLMATGACVGYFLGRNSGVFQGLLLSCLGILCFHPAAVFETGFQMSFLATLAIVICLTNYKPPQRWPKWGQFFAQIFLATLASQLVLLPVFTNVFYKVSLTGLISNMLLVPLASSLMVISFIYYLASLIHLGIIFYYPCLWGLDLFKFLVEFFASFHFSSIPVTAWNKGSIAAYYSLLFLLFHLPQRNFARKIAGPCIGVALLSFAIGYLYTSQNRVYLLSEWEHRAVLVRTHRNMFAFTSGFSSEKLTRVLAALGVDKPVAHFSLLPQTNKEQGVYVPFDDLWPGDEVSVGKARVRAVWELHQAKDGHLWESKGYSGQKQEGISYCLEVDSKSLCVGQQSRFVQLDGKQILVSPLQKTISARW